MSVHCTGDDAGLVLLFATVGVLTVVAAAFWLLCTTTYRFVRVLRKMLEG